MSASKFFLIFLLLPIVLISLLSLTIYGKLYGKKHTIREKKHKKQTKKLLAHIHNFSPSRLKNRT
jgi:exopolysaccharide biosynthesis protein